MKTNERLCFCKVGDIGRGRLGEQWAGVRDIERGGEMYRCVMLGLFLCATSGLFAPVGLGGGENISREPKGPATEPAVMYDGTKLLVDEVISVITESEKTPADKFNSRPTSATQEINDKLSSLYAGKGCQLRLRGFRLDSTSWTYGYGSAARCYAFEISSDAPCRQVKRVKVACSSDSNERGPGRFAVLKNAKEHRAIQEARREAKKNKKTMPLVQASALDVTGVISSVQWHNDNKDGTVVIGLSQVVIDAVK